MDWLQYVIVVFPDLTHFFVYLYGQSTSARLNLFSMYKWKIRSSIYPYKPACLRIKLRREVTCYSLSIVIMVVENSLKVRKMQRSGIDTIKYHT